MPPSFADNTAVDDADLVAAALDGDRAAFAAIYDAYADRVHTMCVHMLGDADEAADVCGEVFLVAFDRLAQLRDPARLRPWLFAICRHEVYRRSTRRRRVHLVEDVSAMDHLTALDGDGDGGQGDEVDAAALATLLRQAAVGLDDRDRLVLELQMQGLEGDDLAAALGTSTSTSYQQVHRMRERMARSLGALLVARQGRRECADLDALLRQWDGQFSVIWRKRIARHTDGCETCERRRRAVPAAIFGAAGASTLVVTPTSVRERVLRDATVGSAGVLARRGWRSDGFPPGHAPRRRRFAGLAIVLVVLGLAALTLPTLLDGDDEEEVAVAGVSVIASTTTTAVPDSATPSSGGPAAGPDTTATTADPSSATTSEPSGSVVPPTTTVADEPPPTRPVRTTVPAPTTTAPRSTTSSQPTTTAPQRTTAAPTTTTTTLAPPVLRLTGPIDLYARAENGGECANQPFTVRVVSGSASAVTLQWTAGRVTGSVAMTRTKVLGGWTATLHVPFGTLGAVTVVAVGTNASGGTGTSNTLTAVASSCQIII